VCWKLDRLGRSLKHLVTTIEDLAAYGVSFISLRDNLDLSTPSGRLMMHIIGAMAEFERELIRGRVTAGIQAARKRGARLGRPRTYVDPAKIKVMRAGGPFVACYRKASSHRQRHSLPCSATNQLTPRRMMITTTEQFEDLRTNALHTLRDIVRQAHCRIVRGHLMVNIGDTDGMTLYHCVRCHRVETLKQLP